MNSNLNQQNWFRIGHGFNLWYRSPLPSPPSPCNVSNFNFNDEFHREINVLNFIYWWLGRISYWEEIKSGWFDCSCRMFEWDNWKCTWRFLDIEMAVLDCHVIRDYSSVVKFVSSCSNDNDWCFGTFPIKIALAAPLYWLLVECKKKRKK